MGISDFMIHNIIFFAVIIAVLIFIMRLFGKTFVGRMFFDKLKLDVPIFGPIVNKIVMARLFQTLSTLIRSGVDIISCLDIASRVTNNLPVERMVLSVKNAVVKGSSLAGEMEKMPVFPKMVVRMTAVGEKSGQLDEMFSKLADYYSDEVDNTMATLSSIIEPVLIVFLGFIVGVVVIVMYLPIFKLAGAVMKGY
jgi:type IV pilus assembly protein PilC